MTPQLEISEVRIRVCKKPTDGVVAWVSCVVNNALALGNIAVRRGQDNRLMLVYPARKSQQEVRYFHFRPINPEAKAILDEAILSSVNHFQE